MVKVAVPNALESSFLFPVLGFRIFAIEYVQEDESHLSFNEQISQSIRLYLIFTTFSFSVL